MRAINLIGAYVAFSDCDVSGHISCRDRRRTRGEAGWSAGPASAE